MLYLNISGKRHRRLCKSVVEWFMSKYLPRHLIEVSVVHRGLLREGVYGWCTVEDCDSRPRSFLIDIHNGLDVDDYTRTLLHELWHVKQFVRGDLRDKRSKRYWKNSDISDIDYCDDPSETEAHEMESSLFSEYLLDTTPKICL
jgi:hypothetical protein